MLLGGGCDGSDGGGSIGSGSGGSDSGGSGSGGYSSGGGHIINVNSPKTINYKDSEDE